MKNYFAFLILIFCATLHISAQKKNLNAAQPANNNAVNQAQPTQKIQTYNTVIEINNGLFSAISGSYKSVATLNFPANVVAIRLYFKPIIQGKLKGATKEEQLKSIGENLLYSDTKDLTGDEYYFALLPDDEAKNNFKEGKPYKYFYDKSIKGEKMVTIRKPPEMAFYPAGNKTLAFASEGLKPVKLEVKIELITE